MDGGYSVRRLNPREWEIFSALRLRALKECPGVYSRSYDEESLKQPEEWQKWLADPANPVFALFDGEKSVGVAGVLVGDTEGQCWFGMAYIAPEYRGRGLVQLLYKARIDWAVGYLPYEYALVGHRIGNEASHHAIESSGFFYERTDKNVKWPDGSVADQNFYRLNLAPLRRPDAGQGLTASGVNVRRDI